MKLDPVAARQIDAFNVANKVQQDAHQTVISYLMAEPPRAAGEAARRSRGWAKDIERPVQTISEYESAISDMINRDLLWVIDENKQSEISGYLSKTPALGPTDGMPGLGTLQISIHFANLLDQLWASIDCERPGFNWARDWQSDSLHLIYSPTPKQCLEFLRDELSAEDNGTPRIAHLSGPNPCGPWRVYWWQKFDAGYVLEVRYES